LREAVERLLQAHASSADFMGTSPFEVGLPGLPPSDTAETPVPTRIGPYRIERELGRGGMGNVYLAERDEPGLRKMVAIKVVRRGMDTEVVLRRFRTERQILAALEHPGIARFYDGGTTDDGLPYFVMEYVPGENLLAYSDDRRLSVAERVRLFRRVCNAVQFAHQGLVIHRDLKPSNILVTPEGEPRLLDFGIAKLVTAQGVGDEGEEATATIFRVMTPEYASPEQVRGERVTTASDVYSLGVILYALLSGHRPYRVKSREAAEIERALTEQEVPAPSAVVSLSETTPSRDGGEPVTITPEAVGDKRNTSPERLRRALRGDLDTIVLTALQKDPGRRYATAAELADDLGRYLEGRPVHAQPDRWSYRATKFVRRHRLAVAAATVAMASLLTGLGAALWEARVARQERVVAQQQRVLAQRRFDEARRLIQTVISDIQPKLAAVPGTTPLRKTLIDSTLSYLEALAHDAGDDPALLRDLAGSYVELARVQGNSGAANVGDSKGARETLVRAAAIVARLLRIDPAGAESLRAAIHVHQQLSRQRVSPPDAVAACGRALALADRLVALQPQDFDARLERAKSFSFLGSALRMGDRSRSADALARSREIYESLLRERPEDPDVLQRLAVVQKIMAGIHYDNGDARGGLDLVAKARAIDEKLLAAHPEDPTAQTDLAIDMSQISSGYDRLGDLPRAISAMEESLALLERILSRNPNDAGVQERLAFTLAILGERHQKAGNTPAAFVEFERASRIDGELRAKGNQNFQVLWMVSAAERGLAQIEKERGHRAAACRHYREATSLYEEQASRGVLDADDKPKLEMLRREASACGGQEKTLTQSP